METGRAGDWEKRRRGESARRTPGEAGREPFSGERKVVRQSREPFSGEWKVVRQSREPFSGERKPVPASGERLSGEREPVPASGERLSGERKSVPTSGEPFSGERKAAPDFADPFSGEGKSLPERPVWLAGWAFACMEARFPPPAAPSCSLYRTSPISRAMVARDLRARLLRGSGVSPPSSQAAARLRRREGKTRPEVTCHRRWAGRFTNQSGSGPAAFAADGGGPG